MTEVTSTATGTGSASDDDDDNARDSDPGLLVVWPLDSGGRAARGLVISGQSHAIGREPPASGFAIKDTAASRIHAVVHRHGDEVRIKDAGSRNGTFVGGERVTERTLVPGDDVRIGDTVFVFVDDDATAHVAYGLDGSVAPDALRVTVPALVGGLAMARVSALVEAAAGSLLGTLVVGETGVGKELVAHGMHVASGRPGRFVALNCAALSPHLVESQLFGHERGAFTSAERRQEGLVRSAHEGTLFLDEIGDLGLEAQAKLLRVLETREVLAVGATRAASVDLKVVCATHRDLRALVGDGRFRLDLLARLSGYEIHVPPLRERKEDLPLLVRALLARAGAAEAQLTIGFMQRLLRHSWPMNVRELIAWIERAVGAARGGELRGAHLPRESVPAPKASPPAGPSPRLRRKTPSKDEIVALMRDHGGNVSAVARALGRDGAQIYRWLKRHAVDPDGFR